MDGWYFQKHRKWNSILFPKGISFRKGKKGGNFLSITSTYSSGVPESLWVLLHDSFDFTSHVCPYDDTSATCSKGTSSLRGPQVDRLRAAGSTLLLERRKKNERSSSHRISGLRPISPWEKILKGYLLEELFFVCAHTLSLPLVIDHLVFATTVEQKRPALWWKSLFLLRVHRL